MVVNFKEHAVDGLEPWRGLASRFAVIGRDGCERDRRICGASKSSRQVATPVRSAGEPRARVCGSLFSSSGAGRRDQHFAPPNPLGLRLATLPGVIPRCACGGEDDLS